MRFICKYDDYKHEIHCGTTTLRPGIGGTYTSEFLSPHLVAAFERTVIPAAEREAARQHYDNADSGMFSGEPPGPYRHDGVFVAADEDNGTGYSGSKHEFYYSVFDTENRSQCPPQYKDAFEAVLSGDAAACIEVSKKHGFAPYLNPTTDLGHTLLRLDKLMARTVTVETPEGAVVVAGSIPGSGKPWPSYDDLKGPGAPNKIREIASATGTPDDVVIAYEQANRNRGAVLAKFGVESVEAPSAPVYDPGQAAKDLAAAMSVTVPA